jgi:ribosomal peptide maturation radical SAM protein 1
METIDPAFLPDQGDTLIIVPAFAGLDRPSLAAHLLQACARRAGFAAPVLYANILLAARIGEINYEAVCYTPTGALLGERFFARAAYGTPPFGRQTCDYEAFFRRLEEKYNGKLKVDLDDLRRLEPAAAEHVDELADAIARRRYRVVGCTSTFEQTAASVALLNAIKRRRPDILTILGGANCEGEMAEGILSLGAAIDYVFSGESEASFPRFLQSVSEGRLPDARIVTGEPCLDLDALPAPDYSEFYQQFHGLLPDSALAESGVLWLPYETSRGCWWGEKHHCTFCGLNAQTMQHREKSPERVITDLQALLEKHPTRRVCMADNIMPHAYLRTLVPRLAGSLPETHIFYEQKANLSLDQVVALVAAGIAEIQPGIEALSTPLLRLMDKGVSARQNIALLRYARAAGMSLNWNLLYGFPGDRAADYEQTLTLAPLLRHLDPPGGLSQLSIDRFSPYFDQPARYGIINRRPMEGYAAVLPEHAEAAKVAYHFSADYPSESREAPELIARLEHEVRGWVALWASDEAALPALALTSLTDSDFLLIDTRGLPDTEQVQFLTREQACIALAGRRPDRSAAAAWALARKLVVELDRFLVPLATAEPALIREFEAEMRGSAQALTPQLRVLDAPAERNFDSL